VRVELLVAAEQLGAAGPARVDADGLGVGVLAGEGPLGAGLAEHLVLGRGELLPPLGLGLDDLADAAGGIVLGIGHLNHSSGHPTG
jgi:hypothetical protein